MNLRSRSITFRTSIPVLLVMTVGFLALILVMQWIASGLLREEMQTNTRLLAEHMAEDLDLVVSDIEKRVTKEASRSTLVKAVMNPAESRYYIEDYLKELNATFGQGHVHLLGYDGAVVAQTIGKAPCAKVTEHALAAIRSGVTKVTLVEQEDADKPVVIGAPIVYGGNVEGALVVCIPFRSFFERDAHALGNARSRVLAVGQTMTLSEKGKRHENVLRITTPCRQLPIRIVIETPKEVLEAPVRAMQFGTVGIGLVVMIACLAALYATLRRRMVAPILRLRNGVVGLGDGAWESIEESSADAEEIGDLVRAFNRMQTSLQERTAMLFQAEKMAGIGQLAAGIAHEINNPAGFVSGNLDTMKRYAEGLLELIDALGEVADACNGGEGSLVPVRQIAEIKERINFAFLRDDMVELLEESSEGMNRIARIVSDLKEFSHIDKLDAMGECDLNQIVEKAINVAWNELKYKCEIKRDFGEMPSLRANGGEISQVILNILINAAQAIEKKGLIEISTGVEEGNAILAVHDNGPGIPAELLNKVFDPFFTTKPVGKGTGLGLHICQKIIAGHGGQIRVKSAPGQGTTVRISLPLQAALTEVEVHP